MRPVTPAQAPSGTMTKPMLALRRSSSSLSALQPLARRRCSGNTDPSGFCHLNQMSEKVSLEEVRIIMVTEIHGWSPEVRRNIMAEGCQGGELLTAQWLGRRENAREGSGTR